MINAKKLEDIAKQISDALPPGVKQFADDMEGKTKQVIQNKLAQLDLVTREEFDVQTRVLMRTREKLADLEQVVAKLETQLNGQTEQAQSQPEQLPNKDSE
ncbi:accessory factor UbiK family protein [Catenovulum sp. 2E275]|uniref:ubiquinone biosynthesis accessory factor UbiK n=1 Tax=Catenovulum sp. 2E275 TaxID=2980497 RepID=UPI0021D02BEC|nr:accessory factor UbiK family protein [Catenovulum sp. 2E275]MCU4677522.1 accessory factor UbiK family protein [Catenovulum sp. 2E275]